VGTPTDGRQAQAAHYRDEGHWRPERLTDHVARWATARPGRTAVVDEDRRLSWSQLWRAACLTAESLRARGVGPGDIVSTQLPNGTDIIVLHLATELAGAIHNPLAVQFREHELDQVVGLLGSALVVHPGSYRGEDYAMVHANTRAGRDGRVVPAAAVVDLDGRGVPAPRLPEVRADEVAFILNTSGTVAIKGVMHTHEEAMFSARLVAGIVQLGPDDTVLCGIPMTWGGGLCWGVRFALYAGATLVSMERWDARAAATLVDAEEVTFTYGPPTLARDLVALSPEWRPATPLRMICAGAPIPRQLCVDARLAGVQVVPGYGQTEHLHSTLGRLHDPVEKLTTTDGSRLPAVDLRAVDEHGHECAPGAPGDLECRGPNVSLGYFGQPELTRETFRADGWQVTNDVGVFDEDGYLRVVGRRRDLIIRGGLNVSPREVEELLLRHPDVRDAAVVGYPDARYGERICAFIVPAGVHAPTVEELSMAFAEMGVAKYKHPERVETIDSLPLTTTGKVRHETLRQRLAAGAVTEDAAGG